MKTKMTNKDRIYKLLIDLNELKVVKGSLEDLFAPYGIKNRTRINSVLRELDLFVERFDSNGKYYEWVGDTPTIQTAALVEDNISKKLKEYNDKRKKAGSIENAGGITIFSDQEKIERYQKEIEKKDEFINVLKCKIIQFQNKTHELMKKSNESVKPLRDIIVELRQKIVELRDENHNLIKQHEASLKKKKEIVILWGLIKIIK